MNTKVILLSAIALTGALLLFAGQNTKTSNSQDLAVGAFSSYRLNFGKSYSTPQELEYRFTVFSSNLEMIEKHNADLTSSYKLGVNEYSDLTFEEFKAKYLGFDATEMDVDEESQVFRATKADEDEVDWVKKGVVHAVKNQARCGSCWAFASTAALESLYAINGKGGLDLSEQELVDCSRSYGNMGCNGGLMHYAYGYIRDHKIHHGENYSYRGTDGSCKAGQIDKPKESLKSFQKINRGVDSLIAAAVHQPVAVAFYVQNDFFQYKSGVYDPPGCKSSPNHAVTLVGYNKKAEKPYFYIKNSWGTTWGDKGYFLMAIKTESGACNIAGHDWNYVPTL